MKTKFFITWLVLTLAAFAYAGKDKISESSAVASMTKPTEPVIIVVDSSFSMKGSDVIVQAQIDAIAPKYAKVALIKSKTAQVAFTENRTLGGLKAYGPRSFRHLTAIEKSDKAEGVDKYLITNAEAHETDSFSDWKVVTIKLQKDKK